MWCFLQQVSMCHNFSQVILLANFPHFIQLNSIIRNTLLHYLIKQLLRYTEENDGTNLLSDVKFEVLFEELTKLQGNIRYYRMKRGDKPCIKRKKVQTCARYAEQHSVKNSIIVIKNKKIIIMFKTHQKKQKKTQQYK